MLEDFRLKVFMTVAAERSFTKAASALGISQPAVSQNISELEKVMDMKLFDRLRGEVAITPQGRIFHQHATRILESYEDLNMIFCNPRIKNRTAPIRMFISPVLSSILLPAMKENIHLLRPSLVLEFIDSSQNAHVSILAVTEKKDADLNIKVNVISDDILLEAFFRQIVNLCL